MFTGMHHISLSVRHLETSIAFYEQFGFRAETIRHSVANDYFRAIVAFPDAVVHTAMLRGPYPVRLELMQYAQPQGTTLDLATNNVGSAHICFLVADIRAETERLKHNGVRFKSDVVTIDAGPNAGASGVYLLDPDGYTMELLQPAAKADTEKEESRA